MSKAIALEAGQIWREKESGRLIKILDRDVHGTGPAWTYCNARGKPEPHGPEVNGFDYDDWYWHYCDAWDFYVWGRFEFVRHGRPAGGKESER